MKIEKETRAFQWMDIDKKSLLAAQYAWVPLDVEVKTVNAHGEILDKMTPIRSSFV